MLAAPQPPARAAAPTLCRWGASWKSHRASCPAVPSFQGQILSDSGLLYVAFKPSRLCHMQSWLGRSALHRQLSCSAASPTFSSPLLNDSWQVCCWVMMFYDFISKYLVFINIVPVLICNYLIACGFCNYKQCLDCYCTFVFPRF